jgi:hypothetical protein
MFKQTLELTLDVRPAEVFRHIALEFFDNHPRWDPDIVELTKTSEGAVGLGTTGREVRDVRGRRFVTDFRITVFRPDEAFSHRSQGGAMGEDVDYAIEGHPPGSNLRMTILAPLIRPQVQRNFTANVGRFEQMLRALPASK